MVEIKLQFKSVEEAITVLGKMAGLGEKKAPQAPAAQVGAAGGNAAGQPSTGAPSTQATTKGRKPRADAGQPRGPNARTAQSNAAAGADIPEGGSAPTTAPEQPAAAPEPAPQAAAPVEADKAHPPGVAPTPAAAAPVTIEQCQAALTEVFEKKGAPIAMAVLSRFGTKRIKEMLPVSYADFITKCNAVLAGEEV